MSLVLSEQRKEENGVTLVSFSRPSFPWSRVSATQSAAVGD